MGRPEGAASAVSGLMEPLTRRELEVLGFIAAGRPNREIAGELVVTLETVKKHASHIFDKLGAANRTEAVARARELRLIPEAGVLLVPPGPPRIPPGVTPLRDAHARS